MSIVEDLESLSLPRSLKERIHVTRTSSASSQTASSFILYLPTVVLRSKHNPAFALACRLANAKKLPLLVLCVVLDDFYHKMPRAHTSQQPIAHTARKQAFTLQAYQKAASEWSSHGAHVYIRVQHPNGGRTPHHISLAVKATAVIVDEPFVYPFRGFVESIERTNATVIRVDGSTTAPPILKLSRIQQSGGVHFRGVPDKAWKWEKQTQGIRRRHVMAVVEDGEFDAPTLDTPSPQTSALNQFLPKEWLDQKQPAPGKRAWTLEEFQQIVPEKWVLECPGIDTSVGVCSQTHGALGEERWATFRSSALPEYARRRNDARQPHAVSRMSCYLNLGTVSIFEIVYQLWRDQRDNTKFLDEIVKWREIGYVHAFASPHYFEQEAVPRWAISWLSASPRNEHSFGYSLESLENGQTNDATWNAMQKYLVQTGELHNNARMTWGKALVHWQRGHVSLPELLEQMACLNDRYALDGLSPPSYAGLLWCLGWCDKPGQYGGISTKPTSRYRLSPDDFENAKRTLLLTSKRPVGSSASDDSVPSKKPKPSASIKNYFQIKSSPKQIIG